MAEQILLGAPPGSPGPKTVAQVLGEVVWLLSQSSTHKQLFIADLEWFCMPPLLLEQFRIYNGPDRPAAVALWAKVSDATQMRLLEGGARLRPDEWRGGEHRWLMELVAPFGGQDEILRDLSSQVFEGGAFRFHQVTPEGQRVVREYQPVMDA